MKTTCVMLLAALTLAGCSRSPEPPKPSAGASPATPAPAVAQVASPAAADADPVHEVAWRKGNVDAAFAEAKAENKPVFLYWGAVWCPPCNQVKATIFNRQDFVERSRFFIPVYIDGDSPSAQKEGARFKVSGYPTMVLFKPDGTEITRLPGEVEADQYMRVLAMGMSGARPVKATLAAALSTAPDVRASLAPEDWRMLAYYSWITDEQQLLPKKDVPETLARLANACPADQPEIATRLSLQALAIAADDKGARPRADAKASQRLVAVLEDPKLARENFDAVVYYAGSIAGHVTAAKSEERTRLVGAWNAALDRFIADSKLATTDRLSAVSAKIELAKLDVPNDASSKLVPAPLLATVREQAARADRETRDIYARQAVISAAADVLATAGLLDESDAMLTAELKRSHSPYYHMLGLASNAKKRGDKASALEWAEKAYAASDGPATRLQWGVAYVRYLVQLAPQDAAKIERAAGLVISELEPTPETFYERNRRSLERMGRELAAWNKDRQHDASVRKIRAQLGSVCSKLPAADPSRAACDGALKPAQAKA